MQFRRAPSVVLLTLLVVGGQPSPSHAQPTLDATGRIELPWGKLPADAAIAQVDKVFTTLKLPIQMAGLKSGNDVGMRFSSVAPSGKVSLAISSAIGQTDAAWLLTLTPAPDGGQHLLASATFSGGTQAEVTFSPRLYHTQTLLAVVRAGGVYYAVAREIKIAQPVTSGTKR